MTDKNHLTELHPLVCLAFGHELSGSITGLAKIMQFCFDSLTILLLSGILRTRQNCVLALNTELTLIAPEKIGDSDTI